MIYYLLFYKLILGQKLYQCPKCDRSYKHRTSYSRHKRLECGKSPAHVCPYCERKFYHKGNLVTHVGLVHNKML